MCSGNLIHIAKEESDQTLAKIISDSKAWCITRSKKIVRKTNGLANNLSGSGHVNQEFVTLTARGSNLIPPVASVTDNNLLSPHLVAHSVYRKT